MTKKLHGVHIPHRKNTSDSKPQRIPIPKTVYIPMSMHIGAPARPLVKPGDPVKVGQLLAEAEGFVSSPIYSGVSGKVKRIEDSLNSAGQFIPTVVIETDGLQTLSEDLAPPTVTGLPEFLEAVRRSGTVGLGGAGFPTAVKLAVKDLAKVEVIINGAECEPYITSDTRTMLDDADLVWEGVRLLKKYLEVKRVIIAIEDNKPQCIKNFKELSAGTDGVEVAAMPSIYPQGGEKVLIFHTTGRVVPEGKLPIDAGAIVVNCTTLASVARYVKTGMPLTEKCVTVDGSAVKEPRNVIAPIGTPVRELFEFCGGFLREPAKVLYGGPMMGISIPDLDQPVLKMTNAVLAFDVREACLPSSTACIRCGRCADHCPMRLMPFEMNGAFKRQDGPALEALKVNLCMECGCCSYVCPAKIQLVQAHKLGKALLRDYQKERKAAEQSATTKKEKEASAV